jgi:hypothetical protein
MLCVLNGCRTPATSLQQLVEARRLAADLSVQFTKAVDAANRAVMADTDETSVAFAGEATTAGDAVHKEAGALAPILKDLGYADEARLLDEFNRRFDEYRSLDRNILDLAIENTNLKAQRLAFGPSQAAADAMSNALDTVIPAGQGPESWRVRSDVATAVAAVRDIQVMQAPHIAEADDAAMTRIEKRMMDSERAARAALETLSSLVAPDRGPQIAAATVALNQFMKLNADIVGLSRRNTNVRSLAMSLGQKRTLTAACEDSLRALQEALATRGFAGTR